MAVVVLGLMAAGMAACALPASGQPQATPTELVFPTVAVGGQDSQDLLVTNVAEQGALTIESIGIAGPDATQFSDELDDDGSVVLDPGESVSIRVRYHPTTAGEHRASLRVNHSGADAFTVPLQGTGVVPDPGAQPLQAAPTSVSFPNATVGQPAQQTVTLTNGTAAGQGSLTITGTTIDGSDAGAFSDDFVDTQPRTLAPGASTTIAVSFAPAAAGDRDARLLVQHTGTNAPLALPLAGTAHLAGTPTVLYRVNAGGSALAPGSGQGGPAWTEDTAAAPSPFGNAGATGNKVASAPPLGPPDASVPAGTPPALFQTERSDAPAAPNLAYAFPVPDGTPVEVRLYLAETAAAAQTVGGRVFDVRVEGGLAHRDVDVFARVGANKGMVLSSPATAGDDGDVDVELVSGVGEPSVKGIEIVAATSQVPPWLAATPAVASFGQAKLRQLSTQDVVLTNVGTTGPLTVTSTSIGGAGSDPKMFTDRFDDATPVVLAPGQSTTVTAAVLPIASGTRRATMLVTHTTAGGTSPNSPLAVPLVATVTPPTASPGPSFGKSLLAGAAPAAPTSLQFGPDGRLYVAQMDGTIRAYTVTRTGEDSYATTATETITAVRDLPNRNDDGTPNPAVTGRLVTGLLVRGTAANPVIYVVSSDPRIGAGTTGGDLNLDTNSGILSRLTRTAPSAWTKVDLVRGLPRSEENHTGNGLALLPGTNTLLIAYGGNTNKGAPAHNFAELPEYALSAAVLSVDLGAIGSTTYDLPTLDDETRPGAADANDPFGGNDGRNQARLVTGGPVQVYAPGFRNPYDLVVTESGRLYTIDNGGNAGWGGAPQPDGPAGTCTNAVVETSDSDLDTLHLITGPGPGSYGGHPNPTRANAANTFNPSNPQSPVGPGQADPVECDYRTEVERAALASFPFSTNGLDEYTAGTFGGSMRGDLLAASQGKSIARIELNAAGTAVTASTTLFSSVGEMPLDVTAQGDADPFPGTIWVADFLADDIIVFEPDTVACSGADDPALDEDGDGFDNADEIDNATNPCSAADVPPDADGDRTSDRNDPDDDNDGRPDIADPFAVDAADGRDTSLPVVLTWDNDAPPAGGILGLGFTGLMADGHSDYLGLFDPTRMTAGGAAGVVTIDEVGDGDALGPANTQTYGFQLGVDATPTSAPFVVHTRLPAPFSAAGGPGGAATATGPSYGIFFGTGSQDDYVKLTVAANGGAGGFLLVDEQGGVPVSVTSAGPAWPSPGAAAVDLFLRVDPVARTVQASYAIGGGPRVAVGGTRTVPASWFGSAAGPAVGLVSTSTGPAPSFPATWDFLEIQPT